MSTKKNSDSLVQLSSLKKKHPNSPYGSVIREYRLQANMEQEELARICGLTGNSVSNWERGVSRPDLNLIPTLCETLGMPLEIFFGMPLRNSLSNEDKSLLADYHELTLPNRRQLQKTLRAILESQEETRLENYKKSFTFLRGHESGLAAGFGTPLDGETETFPVFVRVSRDACRSDDVFPVNGRSMEPKYPDGSMVFVQRVDPNMLTYGDVIACIAAGTPYVKIYEKDGLHSINPDYSVIHISDDDNFRLIGRVLGLVPEEDLATPEEAAELTKLFADELK